MKILDVFRMRIVIFMIQILFLTLFISLMKYEFSLNFDIDILNEQIFIMQFLANYVLFNNLSGFYFIYIIWFSVSLIPIFIHNDVKKAYSMNLLTFFFPNFFLYVFLWRHSRVYFDSNFQFHFLNTILLGIVIVGTSIGLSLILRKILLGRNEPQLGDLESIASSITTTCPRCGTKFNSNPKICYKCNTDLTLKIDDING